MIRFQDSVCFGAFREQNGILRIDMIDQFVSFRVFRGPLALIAERKKAPGLLGGPGAECSEPKRPRGAYFLSEAASSRSPRFIISPELSRLSASKAVVSAASWSAL